MQVTAWNSRSENVSCKRRLLHVHVSGKITIPRLFSILTPNGKHNIRLWMSTLNVTVWYPFCPAWSSITCFRSENAFQDCMKQLIYLTKFDKMGIQQFYLVCTFIIYYLFSFWGRYFENSLGMIVILCSHLHTTKVVCKWPLGIAGLKMLVVRDGYYMYM